MSLNAGPSFHSSIVPFISLPAFLPSCIPHPRESYNFMNVPQPLSLVSWADSMLYLNWGYTLIAVSAALILNVLILWPPKLVLLILKFRPLVWIGRVSYGLYLWHWPVREFIYPKGKILSSVAQLLTVVVVSLLLTTLSYYLVEKRFLGWKKRFSYK